MGGGCEPFTQHPWQRITIVALRIFWVAVFVFLARVDRDSAKSLKSTRGCRSGADDEMRKRPTSRVISTIYAPRFASITERSVVSLVLILGNYKLFVISQRDCAGSSGATRSPSATRRRISRIFCDGAAGAPYLTHLPRSHLTFCARSHFSRIHFTRLKIYNYNL